ncbi:MAG: type II toxin-antitoxin system PemK/MazF family toxin [bacterium]|nr:type II toxin-antitoxin system PemK/MazF family toxin [bacterium]
MTNYSRGDVILTLFPNADLVTAKKRPAVIVQATGLNTGLPQIVICAITTNFARRGQPFRLFVAKDSPEGQASGIISDSVIMTDCLATVRLEFTYRKIGVMTAAVMEKRDGSPYCESLRLKIIINFPELIL